MSFFSRLFRRGEGDGDVCPKCGAPMEAGAAFCGECGTRLAPAAEQAQPDPAASAPKKKQSGGKAPPPPPPAPARAAAPHQAPAPPAQPPPSRRDAGRAAPARPELTAGANLFSPGGDGPAAGQIVGAPILAAMPAKQGPPQAAAPQPAAAATDESLDALLERAAAEALAAPYARPTGKEGRAAAGAAKAPPAQARPKAPPAAAAPVAGSQHKPLTLEPLSVEPAVLPGGVPPTTGVTSKMEAVTASPHVDPRAALATASFQEMLDDVDRGFESIVAPEGAKNGTPPISEAPADAATVRELFGQIAATYVRPVRDFMIEMRWGDPAKEWIEVCLPAVTSLRRSAEQLELKDLVGALETFKTSLELARESAGASVQKDAKELLQGGYADLVRVMPDAFGLEDDSTAREGVLVVSLLAQVPDCRKVALDKLFRAGLTSLSMYFVAKAEDISAATGLASDLSARIVQRFQAYKRELETTPPDATRTAEHDKLTTFVRELKKHHESYEKCAGGWSADSLASKKTHRQARDAALLAVNVSLARLGEVARIRELEKSPFAGKVKALEAFLEEVKLRERRP